MTWKELKEFVNSLDEKQLEQNVILWQEENAISDINAMTLEEDHYVDPEAYENGCFPEFEAKKFVEDEDSYPNGMDDLKKVYDKGHPILWEKF